MTQHSTAFEVERPVPAGEAIGSLLPGANDRGDTPVPAPAPAAIKKFNLRKMLMAGAAVAVLAGAVWYGWDYWTVGRFLVSTDDAYVKADNTTIAPKVSGYLHEVLVPRHSDYDWSILSQSRMGISCGATRISMLRATPD
jgi:membrane fusion protein (multidrug efflux system)